VLNSTLADFSLLADGLASDASVTVTFEEDAFTPRPRAGAAFAHVELRLARGLFLLDRLIGWPSEPIRPSGSPLRRTGWRAP